MVPEKDPSSSPRKPSLLSDLLGTLIVVSSFAISFWSKFSAPENESTNSITPKTDSDEKRDSRDTLPNLIPQIPPTPTNPENTCECCNQKIPGWKKAIEIGTFVAALAAAVGTGIYAHITAETYTEIQRQTAASQRAATAAECAVTQARDQFREDERPYIWITNTGMGGPEYYFPKEAPPTIDSTKIGQIAWTFQYTNYGKSPAYNVVISTSSMRIEKSGQFRHSFGFDEGPKGMGYPAPPGKLDFATAVSYPGITQQRYNELLKKDFGISIKAVIQYTDAYGGKYETGFCLTRLAIGSAQYCEGSYIK